MFPERIVCLTEETTETLYLLEEDWRIVGISGYSERPERARQEKPVIGAFTTAQVEAIIDLRPDLVLGFSDLQTDICADLIRRGIEVHVFNQRSIEGILQMIHTLGRLIDRCEKAAQLADRLQAGLDVARTTTEQRLATGWRRPKVLFEEWDDPLITGIRWVSELIEIAGGEDCYRELGTRSLARDRIVSDLDDVVERNPDIIIGSWCGKPFQPEVVKQRAGWREITAVKNNRLFEIRSSLILQPGPAPLTDGLQALQSIIGRIS